MKREFMDYADCASFPDALPLVTPHMVRARTVELAINAGRSPLEIRQRDYERAKIELTGETEPDRQLAILYPGPHNHPV